MIVTERTTPAGVLTHHQILGQSIDFAAKQLNLTVGSWPSAVTSDSPTLTQVFPVAFDAWDPELLMQLATLLEASPAWQDWSLLIPAITLEQAKEAAWERIKVRRAELEFSGFGWNGYLFDSNSISVQKISGSTQMAMIAQTMGVAFSIDFTLADNSVVTLDGPSMISVGLALGQHVSGIYGTARLKREAIEAATSIEQVAAITWDSP